MPRGPSPHSNGAVKRIAMLPTLLTLSNFFAGLLAVSWGIDALSLTGSEESGLEFYRKLEASCALVFFGMVADALDGKVARLTDSMSGFGRQLDSFADFLNFGVAPALTLYAWTLSEPRGAGWIAVLVYAICCVMRLARFNVGIKTTEGGDKRFFTGVPAPAGALLVLFPIFATKAVPGWPVVPREAISAYMFVVGGLMISKLPTPSLKAAKVRADHARYVLVAVIAIFAALVTYPWVTLFTLDVFYIVTVLVALVQWRRTQPPKAG